MLLQSSKSFALFALASERPFHRHARWFDRDVARWKNIADIETWHPGGEASQQTDDFRVELCGIVAIPRCLPLILALCATFIRARACRMTSLRLARCPRRLPRGSVQLRRDSRLSALFRPR